MRYPSVFSSLKSALIAATLTVALAATAGAAPGSASRERGERLRREDPIIRVLKAVKRFFGVSSQAEVSVPIPVTRS